MGLYNLLNRLKSGVSDTPDTSEKSAGYQAKPRIHAACTPDISDTSQIDCTIEIAANDDAAPWRVSVAIGTPPDALARLRAASLALDKVQAATPPDAPDASCWPHSTAMNGAEMDTFTARLAQFTDRGLILADAERLADKLVQRDREGGDRRVCLECLHLQRGRCGNWQVAGVAIRSRDAQLSPDLVLQLQRCDGFAPEAPNATTDSSPVSTAETPF